MLDWCAQDSVTIRSGGNGWKLAGEEDIPSHIVANQGVATMVVDELKWNRESLSRFHERQRRDPLGHNVAPVTLRSQEQIRAANVRRIALAAIPLPPYSQ